ncbi:hypothetical protein [Enterococcus durans]|nr:hypothetical protein [Enterococcus durans]
MGQKCFLLLSHDLLLTLTISVDFSNDPFVNDLLLFDMIIQ